LKTKKTGLEQELVLNAEELNVLKNKKLEEEITNIQNVYEQAIQTYEKLLSFKETGQKKEKLDELFVEAGLTDLADRIESEKKKIATSFKIPAKITETNNLLT